MKHVFVRLSGALIVATGLVACSGNQTLMPSTGASAPTQPVTESVARAKGPQVLRITAADMEFAGTFQFAKPHLTGTSLNHQVSNGAEKPAAVGYPYDMACAPFGGKCVTMPASTAYNIYVSPDGKHCMNESCWGTPEEFLKGIAGSTYVGLITQYTGGAAGGYKYGDSVAVPYTSLKYSNVFYNNDLGTILAAAVKHFGKVGTSVEYHIFLPPGYDTCQDETTECYSPDNLSAMVFCAYHSSAYVPVLKNNVIYSVEPFAGPTAVVNGKTVHLCQDIEGKPNAVLAQASILAHESFESWSDPLFDPSPSGYINAPSQAEIGDVCAYMFFTNLTIGKTTYNVQDMYSNAVHGCNNQ